MKVREILGQREVVEREQPTPLLCLAKCRIGLEYEWEGIQNYRRQLEQAADDGPVITCVAELDKYYARHTDGSLRDEGGEWVFHAPYTGTKIINAIEAMDEAARILDFRGSYRTSLHVHEDMQDTVFPDDPTRLGAVYCIAEPFMYNFVGNSRDVSNYCVPWYSHSQHFEVYLKAVNATSATSRLVASKASAPTLFAGTFKSLKQHKYSGLNFFSLGDFGTVEWRQAPVTLQKDKIRAWVNLIMRVKKWVVGNPITVEEVIIRASKLGPERFLEQVFESDVNYLLRPTRDVHSAFKLGLSTLYQYAALA